MLFTVENRGIHNPNLFEGYMILTPEQRGNIEMGLDVGASNRQAESISWRKLLWPYGVVVYDIQPTLGKFMISVKLDQSTCFTEHDIQNPSRLTQPWPFHAEV